MRTDTRVRRYGGVTLVEIVVENDGERPRRVRIASELDGPVWPPRTEGLPEAEWDGDAVSARVEPGERRSFGFASPAEPVDPPVSVTADPVATDGGNAVTPADVVRTLGDPRPPRDAVSPPPTSGENRRQSGPDGSGDPESAADGDPGSPADSTPVAGRADGPAAGPPAVRAWLASVEAATLSDAGPDVGAGDPVTVPDPAVLRAVASRAASLADRVEATEPSDTDGDGGVSRS